MHESQAASTHQKIARNVSLLSLSVGMTMVIGLALRMLLPRIMGPEKMGIFYFADSFTNSFFAFLPLGLTTYINRTVPPDHKHVNQIFSTIVAIELLMSVVISAVMLVTLLIMGRSGETLASILIMGVYAAVFNFQRNILQKIFIAIDRVRLISVLNVFVKVLLVGGCLLVLKFSPNVVLVALMHSLSELVGLLYLMSKTRALNFFGAAPSFARLKDILKVSLPFYLAGVLTTFFTDADTNMLGLMANNTEVGYFGSANKLIGVFLLLIPILQSSFTPALSQALQEGIESFTRLARQLINLLLVCSLPLSVTLVLFGHMISEFLYGKGFEASYKIICFLAPVLTMMYVNTLAAACLYLTSTGGSISRIFVIGIVLNVALDYVLIPFGLNRGPGGAGLAVSFTTFICEAYTFLSMLRLFPGRILDLKLLKNMLVILAPCWAGMLFYEPMIALNLWERLGLAALVPFYALVTRLVTVTEIKTFTSFLRSTLQKR